MRIRPEEERARQAVERELGRPVVINDDGSAPGMYDLRVGPAEAPEIAIECIRAVDPIYAETWNVGPARKPWGLAIRGNWLVMIQPGTRVKRLQAPLERLLKELESRGVYEVRTQGLLQWRDPALFDELVAFGVSYASCYEPEGKGKVHLTMPGTGGTVDDEGSEVPRWIGQFLRDPIRHDVLRKLERSGAPERQVFVWATFFGVPWPVESYLTGALSRVPAEAPDLPPPVTGVWIAPDMGYRGVCWDGGVWRLFDAKGRSTEG